MNYKKTNIEAIQTAISVFNCDMAFQNKDINEKNKIATEWTYMNEPLYPHPNDC